jgi:hypothetical protein
VCVKFQRLPGRVSYPDESPHVPDAPCQSVCSAPNNNMREIGNEGNKESCREVAVAVVPAEMPHAMPVPPLSPLLVCAEDMEIKSRKGECAHTPGKPTNQRSQRRQVSKAGATNSSPAAATRSRSRSRGLGKVSPCALYHGFRVATHVAGGPNVGTAATTPARARRVRAGVARRAGSRGAGASTIA